MCHRYRKWLITSISSLPVCYWRTSPRRSHDGLCPSWWSCIASRSPIMQWCIWRSLESQVSRADPSSVRCVCEWKLPLQVGRRDPVQVYFSSVLLQLQGSHDSGVKLLNSVRVDVISTGALLLHHLLIICGTDPLMEQRELTLCKTCSSNCANVCYVQRCTKQILPWLF